MSWRNNLRYTMHDRLFYGEQPYRQFNINDICFIRKDHKCGKMFGASKSCFVACPSEDYLDPMLALMTEKLGKQGFETIIAVKERAYGQDIFCTKICGKIIEAKFCLVILDDQINNKLNIPNPNVYYEYGLMTSLKKHIIPLQKEDLDLAFNIQSYDTIKYNPKNMAAELDRAIKDAIKLTDSGEKIEKAISIPEKSILRKFELAGFERKDHSWFLADVIDDTGFMGLGHHEARFYLYLGKIDEESEKQTYLEDLNVVIFRTEKEFQKRNESLKTYERKLDEITQEMDEYDKKDEDEKTRLGITTDVRYHYLTRDQDETKLNIEKEKSKIGLMSKFYIGFIIDSKIDDDRIIKKAKEVAANHKGFEIVKNEENKIIFGDIEVNFSVHSY